MTLSYGSVKLILRVNGVPFYQKKLQLKFSSPANIALLMWNRKDGAL